MSVRTDTINLIVNVNGNQAQNQLNDLRKKATDVKLEMEKLKKGTDEYKAKAAELKTVAAAMADLKKEIGLTALTEKELVAELNKLKALKGSVIPFSDEFRQLGNQIERVQSRLYDVRNNVQGFASFFSKISDELKQFGVLMLGYLGFQFITQQFHNMLMGAGKLSDQLADLQRVSGMTAEEAAHLNKELKGIDTRTSTEGLREIAIIAGKLGVAKEDIFEFTKAVDMLFVALGDELGNADQITTQLGKILNVFEGKISADSMSKLGNAFVVLANTGSSTGGWIADFDQRLSGVAKSAGISLGALSGLGAGLEETGARVESSATAIQKLIISISADLPKAAKIAGMGVKEFTKLFAEDGTEALLKYSEGLVKNKQSFSEIVSSLKDAGEEGARTVEIITKLGGSADQFRGRIETGKKSIEETTAITEAFDLKNQNLGATLDKLGKDFNSLVSSSAVSGFLVSAVNGAVNLIKWLKDLPNFINKNITAFVAITTALVVYNTTNLLAIAGIIRRTIVEAASAIATKVSTISTALATAAQEAYAAILLLATGRLTIAAAAQRIWNAALVLGAGPISIIIAAVGLLANALVNVYNETVKYTSAMALQEQLSKGVAEDIGQIKQKTEQLASAAGNLNLSLETRKAVLAQLIAQSPEYLKGLTLENITTQAGINIIDDYINSLDRLSKAKNLRKIKDDAELERQKKNLELPGLEIKSDQAGFFSKVFGTGDFGAYTDALKDYNKVTETSIAATDEIARLTKKVNDDIAVETKTLAGLKVGTDAYDRTNRALNNSLKERNSLMGLPTDLGTGNNKPTVSAASGPDNSVGTERARLKAKLETLAAEYDTINRFEIGARKKNKAEQDAVQKQIDALDFKEEKKSKAENKAESEYENLLKEAAKFDEDVKKLRQKAADGLLTEDQKELQQLQEKYSAMTAKALDFYNRKLKYANLSAAALKTLNAQETEIEKGHLDEILRLFKKNLDKNFAEEYQGKQVGITSSYDAKRADAGNDFVNGILTEKQYQTAITSINREEVETRIALAKEYTDVVKRASADEVKLTHEAEQKKLAEAIEARKQAIKDEDEGILANKRLNVLTSPAGSHAELDAKKAELQAKFHLETENMDKTSAMYRVKTEELNNDLKKLDKDYTQAKIDAVASTVNTVFSALQGLNDSINALQNAELARDAAANNTKKRNMQLQVRAKLLSQQQYDVQTAAMDLAQQEKEIKVKREQAQRDKALGIFNAVISNAEAIAKTMASVPFPFNIPLAIAQGVAGALQIAAIEKTPLPTLGTGDWVRDGDKHSDPSGGINAKIERDEAVMSAGAMTNNEVYSIRGTTAQITSTLNKKGGGITWAPGAVLDMPAWRTATPATINSNMPRIMEQGGVVRPISPQKGTGGQTFDLTPLLAKIDTLTTTVANQQTQLHAVVSLQEFKKQEQIYDFIRNTSSISQ